MEIASGVVAEGCCLLDVVLQAASDTTDYSSIFEEAIMSPAITGKTVQGPRNLMPLL